MITVLIAKLSLFYHLECPIFTSHVYIIVVILCGHDISG
jgi:hypothetical protein